ncbi:MAG: PspC domain-containing protein [Defluviitaleaceae bacterium]|nr:PspC domain-containing protein [Defluviitaleaceae bacterium]
MTKRLYRSTSDAKVCGICGGIAKYMGVDPTIVRIITIVAIFMLQLVPGLIVYFILAMIIPREPEHPSVYDGGHYDNRHN